MKRFSKVFICCLLLLSVQLPAVKAQWPGQQQLTAQLSLYENVHTAPMLYIHFDKTIYTSNETAWFTGYLLKSGFAEISQHRVLSLALVRDIDSTIIKQDKYQISNSLSFGCMTLPDSLDAGNYHFMATTNRVTGSTPEVVFIQPVLIKTSFQPKIKAVIRLLETGHTAKSSQFVLAVTTGDGHFLPKPAGVSYRYGSLTKKAKTNTVGEVLFSLNEPSNPADPVIHAKVKYGHDSTFVNFTVPVAVKRASVKFYPEGGDMVDGLPCRVAWEVKDQQNATVTTKAQLYQNGRLINIIETNSYGIGQFSLVPKKNSNYQVRLSRSGFADSTYLLPAVQSAGLSITVKNALVTDTLVMVIRNSGLQKAGIRIHDFRKTFLWKEISLNSSQTTVKIPMAEIPKGLKSITLSDSLGRPLAERIFFAHYDLSKKIVISTDKQVYQQRQKVTLKLQLNGADTLAFVSVACVQADRLSPSLTTDIEAYTYLQSELSTLPLLFKNTRVYENREYLEDILLVRGWRRYTWQDVLKTTAADTLKKHDSLQYRINVKRLDKPVKTPVSILVLRSITSTPFSTTKEGELAFSNEQIMSEYGERFRALVAEKSADDYTIHTIDPYSILNKKYVKSITAEYMSAPSGQQNNEGLYLKDHEGAIRLKEVKITNKKEDIHYVGANECGDYVCMYHVLNCKNHPPSQGVELPVPGKTYLNNTGGEVVYRKCDEQERFIVNIRGIYTKKEYYVNDFANPLEPAFVSTIYWNHGIFLHPKEQELSFYTSDITGKFKITVQGITANDVIYGQQEFEVKSK